MENNSEIIQCETIVKKKYKGGGKPTNPKYFMEYYRKNNKQVICDCGQSISSFYQTKHKKQKKHIYLMENKILKETLGNLEKNTLANLDLEN